MKTLLIVGVLAVVIYLLGYFWHRKSITTDVGIEPASLGYGISSDDLTTLVCSKVCNGKLFPDYNYLSVLFSGNYNAADWEPKFQKEQEGIDKIRGWAKALPLCPLRSEYLSWMDYYQNKLDSARKELRTKDEKKHMDGYYTEQKKQGDRIRDVVIEEPK